MDDLAWRELLAPSSPLVDQPLDLRTALTTRDYPTASTELTQVTAHMSEGAQQVIKGVCLYYKHMHYRSCGDLRKSQEAIDEAKGTYGKRAVDLCYLGTVLAGIATGRLDRYSFKGARDLTHRVLEPDAARAILRGIKLRHRTLRAVVVDALRYFAERAYAKAHRTRTADALPRRDS